jgi:hypothetical protein
MGEGEAVRGAWVAVVVKDRVPGCSGWGDDCATTMKATLATTAIGLARIDACGFRTLRDNGGNPPRDVLLRTVTRIVEVGGTEGDE